MALCAALLVGGIAHAQVATDTPPPVRSAIDANGVDLVSGTLNLDDVQVAIGKADSGGLTRTYFGRIVLGAFSPRDNLTGTINSTGTTYIVSLGAASYSYSLSGSTFTSLEGDGSTLTKTNATTYTWVRRDGATGVFSTSIIGGPGTAANVARITSLTHPSGEVDTYTYTSHSYKIITVVVTGFRLDAVTNNLGYEIKYLYQSTNNSLTDFVLSQVIGLNNAVDYCAPTATSCTGLTVTWPSVSFSSSNPFLMTDELGRQTTYFNPQASSTQTLTRPSGATLTVTYDSSTRVTAFSNGTGTWNYAYVDGTNRTTTVTDPNGHTRVVVSNLSTLLVLSDTDGTSHTTSYTYDSNSRLKKILRPETDFISYTYDSRGNVTQVVVTGKDQVSTLTTSAGYDTTCAAPAKCNKPNWTRDAKSQQTDYTYSAATGRTLSVVLPAGANGLRPETDYTYTSLYAWYKNSAGAVVQAAAPVSLPTLVSHCVTAQTCPGSASAVQTVIGYGSSGVANNRMPLITTQESGDGVLAASTSYTYDAVGNQLTQQDPLGHVTRLRYDAARQVVGVVGPDPDGGGALHNRALRLTYECDMTVKSGCDGLVTLTEQGTVLSQSDSDWPGFVVLGQNATTYDGVDRRILEKASSGSTYTGVAQYSYDTANRPTCSTVRMNPAAIGSLPASACTLGTAGANGPDRITQFSYDNADRLLKTTSAFGTTVQANDVTYTYGSNGEVLTQADALGHLTTLVRDTFNRVHQVEFPTPSNGAVSSTTDYEQYTYDNNGNVTENRRRDGTLVDIGYDALNLPTSGYNGATFGYDNLGRLTSASVGGQSLSFGYNALNQSTSETSPLGTVSRQYYLDGTRKQLTYPDGYYVTYGYDAAQELTSITDSSAVTLMSMGYDNLGRPTSITRALGPSESFSYGADLRLSALSFALADTSKNVTFNYTYNLAGQPLSATASNASYRSTTSHAAAAYVSDGQNRYTMVAGNSLAYDGRANTTSTGAATGFVYDGLNRMIHLGTTTTLGYDAVGRLNLKVDHTTGTTQFLSDGQQIIAEYSNTNALLRRYVPGPGLDQPLIWFEGTGTASSSAQWLLANAFGSIVAVGTSGASNTTLGINTYDEFGVGGAGNIGRFQYKGMPYIPEIGLYHARARTYSQNLGRFLQPDPAGFVNGLNLYAFANNSPVNGADPTGLDCIIDEDGRVIECDVPAPRLPNPPPDYSPPLFTPPPVVTPPWPVLPGIARATGGAQSKQSSVVQTACSFAGGDNPDSNLDQFTSVVGLYDDTGRAFGAAGRSLIALGANVSRFAGPIGTALSAVQTASQVNNGQYLDAAFTTADFLLASGLSLTGPLGIAADVGLNAAGGTKAAARGAAGLICKFGGGP